MENNTQNEIFASAFPVWMGQWRLTTLDSDGCMFVLRFLLRAFRSRRPEDQFWSFLDRFLFAEDHRRQAISCPYRTHATGDLLAWAAALPCEQGRALLAFLNECYAADHDRSFWNTVSEAIQFYLVEPYEGLAAGRA
jgi:hypothetical protein